MKVTYPLWWPLLAASIFLAASDHPWWVLVTRFLARAVWIRRS